MPPHRAHDDRSLSGHRGQATVEMVALLPLLLVGVLGGWQLVLFGHAVWSAHGAARAAARAHAVGADELRAARGSLPAAMHGRVRVGRPDEDGQVPVFLVVPTLLPGLDLGTVTATAGFADQR